MKSWKRKEAMDNKRQEWIRRGKKAKGGGGAKRRELQGREWRWIVNENWRTNNGCSLRSAHRPTNEDKDLNHWPENNLNYQQTYSFSLRKEQRHNVAIIQHGVKHYHSPSPENPRTSYNNTTIHLLTTKPTVHFLHSPSPTFSLCCSWIRCASC